MTDFFNETLSSRWFDLCPELKTQQQLIYAGNVTRSQVQPKLWDCFLNYFLALTTLYGNLIIYVPLTLACIGVLGSALITITFYKAKNDFQAPTYRYFRVLVVVQCLNMIATLHGSIRLLAGNADQRYYAWFFITTYIESMLSFVSTSWADLIILYLSVERCVACLLPARFYKLIGKRLFIIVIVSTFLLAFSSEILEVAFKVIRYDTQLHVYLTGTPNTAADKIGAYYRSAFMTAKCVLLVLSTSGAVVGFYSTYKKKKNLKLSQSEWKVTAQLCILQLTQAVPTIFSSLAVAVALSSIKLDGALKIDVRNLTIATNENINEAVWNWYSAFNSIVFFACATIFSHSIHFYLYFACSKPFRTAALKAILPCFKFNSASGTTNQNQLPRSPPMQPGLRTGQTNSTTRRRGDNSDRVRSILKTENRQGNEMLPVQS